LEKSWALSSATTPKQQHRHRHLRQAAGGATSASSAAAVSNGDVAAILTRPSPARKKSWLAIVDLMKALDVDSSQNARKELAEELKYSGDMNDSAAMNVWLHKQMMAQLAANGGKLPPDMKP